jgi:hypothetical protein
MHKVQGAGYFANGSRLPSKLALNGVLHGMFENKHYLDQRNLELPLMQLTEQDVNR